MNACPHPSLRKAPSGYVCAQCGQPVALGSSPEGKISPGGLLISDRPAATAWRHRAVFGLHAGGLVVGAATLPMAWLALELVPFFAWIISVLATLCHEMGHALAALVTGRPALPAFDFTHGGGVTMAGERRWWLLALYAVAVGVAWQQMAEQPRRRWALGIGTLFIMLLLITGLDEMWFVAMGHGGELVVAGIFLHRALTGVAEVYPGERWLYGIIAWCLLGHALGMCWMLLYDPAFQHTYLLGKRGMDNDLARLASDHLGTSMRTVVWLNLMACLAVVPAALLAAVWWPREGALSRTRSDATGSR